MLKMSKFIEAIVNSDTYNQRYGESTRKLYQLRTNEYGVFGITELGLYETVNINGRIEKKLIKALPIFCYIEKFFLSAPDEPSRYFSVFTRATRIRNYLAYIFDAQIPLIVDGEVGGGHSYYIATLNNHKNIYSEDIGKLFEKDNKDIIRHLKNRFKLAEKLLKRISTFQKSNAEDIKKKGMLYDKIINLYGYSIWETDIVDSFFYRWIIIELIANSKLSRKKRDDWDVEDKVDALIAGLNLRTNSSTLNKEIKLRNKIAHTGIDMDIYTKAFEFKNGFAMNASKELLNIKIQELNL